MVFCSNPIYLEEKISLVEELFQLVVDKIELDVCSQILGWIVVVEVLVFVEELDCKMLVDIVDLLDIDKEIHAILVDIDHLQDLLHLVRNFVVVVVEE